MSGQVSCPQCGTRNESDAAFCEGCGFVDELHPTAAPRIITERRDFSRITTPFGKSLSNDQQRHYFSSVSSSRSVAMVLIAAG